MRMGVSPRLAWLMAALLSIAYLVNYVDRQVVFSIFPVLERERRFSDAQLRLIGTVFIWVYSLCMPFMGRIADVLRRDRLVLVSLLLWSLATCGTGLCGAVPAFLFWRAMMGVSASLLMPARLGPRRGLLLSITAR